MATKIFCDICGAPAREDTEVKVRYPFGEIRKDDEHNEYKLNITATVTFVAPLNNGRADLCAKCTLLILDELKKKVVGEVV